MLNMLKAIRFVGVVAGCAVLAIGGATVFVPQGATAQGKPPVSDVRVVNTAGESVPVAAQGTTNVAGTVAIGNTPTVTLS